VAQEDAESVHAEPIQDEEVAANVTTATMTDEDRAELEAIRARDFADRPAVTYDGPMTTTESFLQELATVDPARISDGVPVSIELPYGPEIDDATRAIDVFEMKEFVESLGGLFENYFKYPHAVYATVPLASLSELAAHEKVTELSWRLLGPPIEYGYSGDDIRASLHLNEFIGAGYSAENGSKLDGTKPVRVGVIEWTSDAKPNFPHRDHVSWQDWAGGPSRLKHVYLCKSSTNACTTTTANVQVTQQHGSLVSGLVGMSIEQGQDPSYSGSGTFSQKQRSFTAPEVEIYYYAVHYNGIVADVQAYQLALNRAIDDGVDIINMSHGFSRLDENNQVVEVECDEAFNPGSINATIRNSYNASGTEGVLYVAAVGQDYAQEQNPPCRIGYPAVRPEVLSVAGALPILPYTDAPLVSQNFKGGIATSVSPNAYPLRATSGVDLVAPVFSEFEYILWAQGNSGSSSYSTTHGYLGSSFASPVVAGSAALMKNSLHHTGWFNSKNYPGRLKAVMLLNGDSMRMVGGQIQYANTGTDAATGYGRLQAHYDAPTSLGTGSGWDMGTRTLAPSQVDYIPINGEDPLPSNTRGLKAVMHWSESDYVQIADIVFSLQRVDCSSGVVLATTLYDATYNMTKFIRYPSTFLANKCWRLRIASNAAEGSQSVHYALLWYSDSDTGEY